MWVLIGFVVSLLLTYMLQHARVVFALFFIALLVFGFLHPYFAVGEGTALTILAGSYFARSP